MEFDQELDTRGLSCPLPILKTKKSLNGLHVRSGAEDRRDGPGFGQGHAGLLEADRQCPSRPRTRRTRRSSSTCGRSSRDLERRGGGARGNPGVAAGTAFRPRLSELAHHQREAPHPIAGKQAGDASAASEEATTTPVPVAYAMRWRCCWRGRRASRKPASPATLATPAAAAIVDGRATDSRNASLARRSASCVSRLDSSILSSTASMAASVGACFMDWMPSRRDGPRAAAASRERGDRDSSRRSHR